MKKVYFFIAVIFMFSCSAQKSFINKNYLKKAEQGYLSTLRSNNNGAVESAIFEIMRNHLRFPKRDNLRLRKVLVRLSTTGSTPTIRYKADLANQILRCSDQTFISKIVAEYYDPDKLFNIVFDILNEHAVLTNNINDELISTK